VRLVVERARVIAASAGGSTGGERGIAESARVVNTVLVGW
jgi:hypothetical protein